MGQFHPRWTEKNSFMSFLKNVLLLKTKTKSVLLLPIFRYKWIVYGWSYKLFIWNHIKITGYKPRLVAWSFSQKPSIDYEETNSSVVDAITLRFLISEKFWTCIFKNVVVTYLYGSLDNYIYIKIPQKDLRYLKHINQVLKNYIQ